MHEAITPAYVRGRVRLHATPACGVLHYRQHRGIRLVNTRRLTDWIGNQVMYDWGTIAGMLLTQGLSRYRLAAMYLEYENVASAGDPVSVPAFDRSGGVDYYNGLSGSADRDYLRVPLIAASLDSSDEDQFPGGNRMTFFAQSQGTVGVHGKPFSDADNSKLFGAALVATPDTDDATQDLVFSRLYFGSSDQQVKLPSSQLGVEWELELQ